MQRGLRWIALAVAFALTGCGWLGGGGKPETYVTPEGYQASTARVGPYVLDAVYLNDSTSGIEGVVRLTWWHVFSVTLQNRSRGEIAIRPEQFEMVDAAGNISKALTLDEVLAYRSHLFGPLMSYQRRAIRRAMWTSDTIPPGAFAVGYLFFSREGDEADIPPWKLTLDPSEYKDDDELVTAFPALRQEYAARRAAMPEPEPEPEPEPAEAEPASVSPDTSVVETDMEEAPDAPDAMESSPEDSVAADEAGSEEMAPTTALEGGESDAMTGSSVEGTEPSMDSTTSEEAATGEPAGEESAPDEGSGEGDDAEPESAVPDTPGAGAVAPDGTE